MNIEQSLERYGTITFAPSFIRNLLELDAPRGRVDISRWWSFVPEVYQPRLAPLVAQACNEFVNHPIEGNGKGLLDQLAVAIHRACLAGAEPIAVPNWAL